MSTTAVAQVVVEPRVSMVVQIAWLVAWLVNNIGITMLNKYAFSRAGFHYPLVVSAFHMLCNWLGTVVYFVASGEERKALKQQHWRTLVAFSVVFALNISVGNISSSLVPVSFNQVMRSLVPALVMVIGTQIFGKVFSRARKLAVIPVVVGVALACYGETAESVVGVGVTMLCIVLAALKVVLSGEMLTGEMKMPPLHLLSYMAPMALVQMVFMAFAFGEVADLGANWATLKGGVVLYVVAITGIGSFSLNLCSLQANKLTSPLTLSIMANVKQVLLIAFSTVAYSEPTTVLNIIGFFVVVIASTRYSIISVGERNRDVRDAKVVETGTGPLLPK